jgi:hypothetical protein
MLTRPRSEPLCTSGGRSISPVHNCRYALADERAMGQSGRVTGDLRTAWVEDLQCCGRPFAVGENVRWELNGIDAGRRQFLAAVFGEGTAGLITDCYIRHEPYQRGDVVSAVVRSITVVAWDWPYLGGDTLEDLSPSTPAAVFLHEQRAADGDDQVEGRACNGYLVELQLVTANPSA